MGRPAAGVGLPIENSVEPPPPAHAREFVRGGRKGIVPVGRQVLERERHADERVVGRVEASGEGTERGRDATGVHIEGLRQPGTDTHVEGVGLGCLELQRPDLGDHGHPLHQGHLGDERQPQRAHGAVLVVGVVEPALVLGLHRRVRGAGLTRQAYVLAEPVPARRRRVLASARARPRQAPRRARPAVDQETTWPRAYREPA